MSPASPICFNQTVTLTDLSGGVTSCTSATFSWSVTPATGWSFVGGTSSTTQNPQIQFITPGTYTITQSVTNVCGTYTKPRVMQVIGNPTVTIPNGPFTICEFPPAPLNVIVDFSLAPYKPTYSVAPYTPSGYSWTVDAPSADYEFLTAATVAEPQIKFKEFRTYNVTVTVSGSCGGTSSQTYVINVKPKPTITSSLPAQIICSGGTTSATVLAADLSGTTFSWTATASPSGSITGFTSPASGGTISATTLTNATTAPGILTYTITPSKDGCSGTAQTMTVTVNPVASVSAVSDQVVCNGANTNAVNFASPTTGGTIVYNWTNSNTAIGLGASGTGNIASFTATNSTTAVISGTITVTPVYTNGGVSCTGTPRSFTISVNPIPTINAVSDQVVCAGGNTTAVTFSGSMSGTGVTYQWQNNTTSIGLAASGTGTITAFTAVNTSTAPVVATITVTPQYTFGGRTCSGTPTTFTITVNPTATVTSVPPQVICNGSNTTAVSFTSPTTGGTIIYNWTNSNTAIGLGASGVGDIASFIATNSTAAVIAGTITVTPSYTSSSVTCAGTPRSFTITVNPGPVISDKVVSTCSNQLFTTPLTNGVGGDVIPAGTTYSWSVPQVTGSMTGGQSGSGTSVTGTLVNSTTQPQTATYVVTPSYSNGGTTCTGGTFTVTVTVNPVAVVNAIQDQVVCTGSTTNAVSFSSPTTGGAIVYNWSNSNAAIGLGTSGSGDIASFTATNNTSGVIAGTITVTPVYTNNVVTCSGTPSSFIITVNPRPVIGNKTLSACSSQSFTVPLTNGTGGDVIPTGTTYSWSTPQVTGNMTGGQSGSGGTVSGTLVNSTNQPQTATYLVTPTYSSGGVACSGGTFTVTVTVNPTASVNAINDQVICNGAPTTSVTPGSPTTGGSIVYNWTNSNTAIALGASGTGNISSFTATNATAGVISATITVTPVYSNGGSTCTGTPTSFTITVNPTVSVTAVPNQVICNGSGTTAVNFASPTTVGTIVYNWTNSNTAIGLSASGTGDIASFTATNNTASVIAGTITVTPSYTNSAVTCGGTPRSFTISVNPRPVLTDKMLTACSNETFQVPGLVGGTSGEIIPTGTVFTWSAPQVTGGMTGGQSGSGTSMSGTLVNGTTQPQTATYVVTPSYANGGTSCSGGTFTVTVTVNPNATINAIANQVLCNGSPSSAINFTSPATGGTILYYWGNSNTAIGLGAFGNGDISSFTATNSSAGVISGTITATPYFSNGGASCEGSPSSFTITVNPRPLINAKTLNTCSSQPFSVSLTNGVGGDVIPAGTTYSWSAPQVTGNMTGGQSGSGGTISGTLINPTSQPQTATYIVTPSYTSGGVTCTGGTFTVTVTVNAGSSIQDETRTICSGEQFSVDPTANSFNVVPAGTLYSWQAPSITGISNTASGSGLSVISGSPVNTTNAPILVAYTITPSIGGACTGVPFTVSVTVNPKPAIGNYSQVICTGGSYSFTPSNGQPTASTIVPANTTYTWSAPTVSGIAGTISGSNATSFSSGILSNTTDAPINVIYIVSPVSPLGPCSGGTFTVTVTVNPKPVIGNKVLSTCNSQPFTVPLANGSGGDVIPTGTTYSWSAPQVTGNMTGGQSGSGGSVTGTLINATNQPQTATYIVTPTYSNGGTACAGGTFTVTVTVNPGPAIGNYSTSICSGESYSLTPTNGLPTASTIVPDNTTYTWSAPSVTGISGTIAGTSSTSFSSGTLLNATNAPINVVYSLTPTSPLGPCTGGIFTVTVTVNPRPVIGTQTQTICSGGDFSVTPVNNAPTTIVPTGITYTWSFIDNPNVSGEANQLTGVASITGTLTNNTTVTQTVDYTVTPTSGSCVGGTFTVTITVSPKPVIGTMTQTICSGESFNLTPVDNAPTTIVPSGTTYTWVAIDNANVSGDVNQIVGVGSISGTLTNNTNVVQTVSYTVTPSVSGGCVGGTFTVTVTVNPKPVIGALAQTICSEGTFSLTPANNAPTTIVPNGTTYTWVYVDNPNVSGEANQVTGVGSITGTLINNTNVTQTVQYTVTPTSGVSGSCVGGTFTVTITISPRPLVQDQSTTICSGASFSVTPTNGSGNIVPAGTTYTWVYVNNANISGGVNNTSQASSINGTLTNNTNVVQTVQYAVTPSANGSCVGGTFTLTVTVNPKPVVPAQAFTVCNGGTFTLTLANNQPTTIIPFNTTYTWTVAPNANVTGQTNQLTGQSSVIQTLFNATTNIHTLAYTITPTSGAQGACVGSPFTLTATINPDAKAELTVTQTISCAPFRIRNAVALVPHINANNQPAFRWYANNVLIGQGATVPDHIITQPGDTVVLKLVAISLHGCKNDSTSVTLYTIQQPQPSFTLSRDTACGPASILITNTTTPINVINGSTYNWNFGNGQTSTQVQPGSITFLANPAGRDTTYYINLSVTTVCETRTFRDSVLIRPGPRALFQPDTTVYCSPANMRFRNNSLGVNSALYGASNRFIWDWGDGRRDTVSDTRTMTKLYTTGVIDTITVKLYAYNECGVDSFAVDIVLYPATITPSLIVFGQNTYGCAPKPVTFVNNSVGGTSYTINFGDGSTPYVTPRSNDTVSHIYQTAGTYTVTLRAQNSCTDTTVTQIINIYANPVANFTTNSNVYCFRDSVRITNTTTPSGSQYFWNMGDGTLYSGLIHPTHYYASAGTYTITLIATSTFAAGAACRDTIRKQIVVNPVPVAAFSSNISTYNCSPFTLSAYATPANYSSVVWYVLNSSGGVVTSSNGFTFTTVVPTPGNYQVKMVGYNSLGCRDSISTPFTVVASPTVSFSVADTVFCAPSSTVTFTNTSTTTTGSTLSYQWFVNGVAQSTNSTSFSYLFTIPANATQPLVYTVRLIATASVTGCAPVYERTITMLPSGQVNQPINQISCTGNTVPSTVFTTLNSGGVTSYAWTNSLSSIGLSASGTGNVPGFTATNSGLSPLTATVSVTPSFSFGGRSCAGSPKQYQIVVNPQAQVNQPANLTVCNGQLTAVNFTSSNTGGTTTYSWTNNNPSIGILASNTGSIATFYAINSGTTPVTATIVVTPSYTSGGLTCTGPTKTFTITVNPTAQVDQPANQVVCNGSTVNFGFTSPTSGGTVTYRWVNSNPTIGLAQSGSGSSASFVCTNTGTSPAVATITVVPNFSFNGSSCDGPSKTFTITVNPSGQVNQPQSQVKCNGDLAQGTFFSTLQTGGIVSYNWINNTPSIGLAPFGSGDIDSFRVVNSGTSPVVATLTVNPTFTNGGVSCVGPSKQFTITVNPTATVNTIANVQVCDGVRTTPINFTSSASGGVISYTWINSNTAIGLPASGTGNLPAFTATNGSSAPITAQITVTPTFTNGGISCTGTPRTFMITVLPLPQTRFRVTPDSACAPMVVTFTNLTQYADSYRWLLDGVEFSTMQTPPPMVLSQAGRTYTFTLLAGNTQGGCGPTSFTYTVRTLPTPRALFGLNGSAADTLFACKQLLVQTANSSFMNQAGNTTGLTYQWYVNNQLQSTALNPRFTLINTSYTRDSLFEIKLIVASGAGCIDSLKRWVRLYPEPLASFSINGGTSDCARPRNGLVKTVQNNSLVKLPAQYSWSVYNRTAAAPSTAVLISNPTAASPSFTFPDNLSAADSTYDIRLRVTSVDGCIKDTVISQVVFARPIVNFRITDSVSCTGTLNVSFLDLSLSPTSSITSRLWNFDDGGQFSTLPAVAHTYSQYGTYFPSLYVTNARGCISDTLRKRIVVFGAPVADFIANSPVCLGTPTLFTNTSQLGWGSTQFTQFSWDFGDGNTSTQQNPIHTYANSGTYTVILTVRSDSSCVPRTKSLTVTVSGKPRADFSYSGSCTNVPIQFTNLSTVGFAEGGYAVVNWNFGNGQQSTQTNPVVTYNTPGSYSVQLIVSGITCPQLRDTITKVILVQRGRADSTYPRIFASRLNRFTMSALPGGISYLWTPPIGLSHPTRAITDAYYLGADPSKLTYTILIKDSSGCINNDKQEVWVFEKPDVYAPTAFTPNKDSANDEFIPFYINIKSLESFRIFNRWGVKIFETNDMSKHWDGKINGVNAPLETYTWVVECYDVNGVKLVRKGMVTLIRY